MVGIFCFIKYVKKTPAHCGCGNSNRRLLYATAKGSLEKIESIMIQYGYKLKLDVDIIPEDNETLFICSGMQKMKNLFINPNGTKISSLQSCIRTNDIEQVGNGQHLTYFEMLGNFSFGNNDYEVSCKMWDEIVKKLFIDVSYVTYHPDRQDHKEIWRKLGYYTKESLDTIWSDGTTGGYCCEMFVGDVEIGNLVNTMGHSVDVGFGLERLQQIIEKKSRIDETIFFDIQLHPIVRDHVRCLVSMKKNGIIPSNKGKGYVCRRLLRRMLGLLDQTIPEIQDWIDIERSMREKLIHNGKKYWNRHKNKTPSFWWETYGILPEEISLLSL